MAFITVPLLISGALAVRYIRRRNRERALANRNGAPVEQLDPSVVSATIVLSSLSSSLRERTLESLPPEMARAIVLVMPELPPVARGTVEKEQKRWLSLFHPPLSMLAETEAADGRQLAAATVRLILEDSVD